MLMNILCLVAGAIAGLLIGVNNPTVAAAASKLAKDAQAKLKAKP